MSANDLIEVIPLTGLNRALAYRVPGNMQHAVQVGSLVKVPLMNRRVLGVVRHLSCAQAVPLAKVKYIFEVLYAWPVVTPDLLTLAQWLQGYYASTPEAVYEIMIPAAVRSGMSPKMQKWLELAKPLSDAEWQQLNRRAPKQAQLYTFLKSQFQPILRSTVLTRLKLTASSCDALIKRGVIKEVQRRSERDAYSDLFAKAEERVEQTVVLNAEQQAAFADMASSIDTAKFKTHLLHGVTGSGKTEVYLATIQKALAVGGGVIFLVPEVALTPQTVGRLRSRLEKDGHKVVVWHSHLSAGERFDAWFSLVKGESRVVVGARSAIFAPVQQLRLIVVDEEHEPAYKQGEVPRYHGRDVAVYRAMLCKAVCVLGSATPSLESLYNQEKKNYRLNTLTKRVDDRQLPKVHIVDMKREKFTPQGLPTISTLLAEKLQNRMDNREQSILFINRRGYFKSMVCPECSHVATCQHCDVSLTYHRTDERLKCHICGYQERAPQRCPKCRSSKIRWRGYGTQKVEDVVQKIVPQAKIVRMDADTMVKKHLFRSILADFRVGKIDILIGTQMIAKGLDFPNVTLVGLVDADISMHVQDFRAGERTFQLVVQVAGRAGRGDRAGEVVIQTMAPQNAAIQYARKGDFEAYLLDELAQRKEFRYPPYRHIVRHLFRGRNPEKVLFFAEKWTALLESKIEHSIEIRGPAPAPLEKLKDYYRFHLWYFMGNVSKIMPSIIELRKHFPMDDAVIDVFDVDPVDLT